MPICKDLQTQKSKVAEVLHPDNGPNRDALARAPSFERTLAWIAGEKHIRQCIPFPGMADKVYI